MMFSINIQAQDYINDISTLVNKTHSERTIILTPFYERGIRYLDSVTVFSKIKEIEILAKNNNDEALLFEIELMRVHYYYYRDYFKKEFVVKKIKELDKKAKTKNILWLEVRTQNLLANYLYKMHKEYGLGFEHFERSTQLLENLTVEEFPLKPFFLHQIASVHYTFKEYENTIHFLKKAIKAKSKYENYYYEINTYNTLGLSYQQLKILDSADYYFKSVITKAIKKKDTVWEGIGSGNLGYNYFLKGNYSEANKLLEFDFEIAKKNKDWGLAAGALTILGEIAFKKEDYNKAQKFAKEANYYANKSGQYSRFSQLYPLLSKIAAHQFKPERASLYLDSTLIVKDSLIKTYNSLKLLRAKQRIQIEQQKLKEEVEQQEQSKRFWLRNNIILLLGILIVIGLLLYNRYRLKSKNREQQMTSQKELTEQKLNYATIRLNNFKESIHEKNTLIEQFEGYLNKANKTIKDFKDNPKPNASSKTIKQLQESAILTDKDWREFTTLFETVYPDFFNRLNEKFPDLTASETRLMALYRLRLNNKDMALILGVGASAIRQIKSRLGKKINIADTKNLRNISLNI